MANLLPPEQLKTLRQERAIRLVVLALTFLAALELLAIVLLVPPFLLARSKRENVALHVATIEQLIAQRERDTTASTIQETQEQIKELSHIAELPTMTAYIERIIEHRGPGVTLGGITYTIGQKTEGENETTLATITVQGRAHTRDGLLAFVKRLEREPDFGGVVLPVSNLAQREDISFTVHITVRAPAHN